MDKISPRPMYANSKGADVIQSLFHHPNTSAHIRIQLQNMDVGAAIDISSPILAPRILFDSLQLKAVFLANYHILHAWN
jgi:hypothetical protein